MFILMRALLEKKSRQKGSVTMLVSETEQVGAVTGGFWSFGLENCRKQLQLLCVQSVCQVPADLQAV